MSTILPSNRVKLARYYDFFNGNLDGLYTIAANDVNGLTYIKNNEVSKAFNYFAASSRFYSDAMLGDVPDGDMPYDVLERLVRDWSITGEAVAIRYNGRLIAIESRYFFPVPELDDDATFRRFLFVFPILSEHQVSTGKARVIDLDASTGQATIGTRDYTGGQVGDSTGGTPITIDMAWIRTNDGAYGNMEKLVAEVNMRMSVTQHSLNAIAFPLLQVDIDSVSDGQFSTGGGNRAMVARKGLGLTVPTPFSGEEGARYVERAFPTVAEQLDYLRLLIGKLSIAAGVPDYVYGVNLGQPQSETERILFAGQAKINRFRKALIEGLAPLGITLGFPSEPFVTRKQRIETLVMLLDKGIITAQEARLVLGFE